MGSDSDFVLCRHSLDSVNGEAVAHRSYLAQSGIFVPANERWVPLDQAKRYHRETDAETARRMLFELRGENAKAIEVVKVKTALAFEGRTE